MKKFLVVLFYRNRVNDQYRWLHLDTEEEVKLFKKQIKKDNIKLKLQGKNSFICDIVYIAKIEEVLYEKKGR